MNSILKGLCVQNIIKGHQVVYSLKTFKVIIRLSLTKIKWQILLLKRRCNVFDLFPLLTYFASYVYDKVNNYFLIYSYLFAKSFISCY